LANSIPKSGTHLLARCLELCPGIIDSGVHINRRTDINHLRTTLAELPRSSFATAHLPFTHERAPAIKACDVAHVLIIRDPRDVVVSHFHYVVRQENHPLNTYYANLPDRSAQLMTSIRGINVNSTVVGRGLESIAERFRLYLQWEDHGCHITRFCDLVGPHGGGTTSQQIKAIRRLATHLGIELQENHVDRIAERVYSERTTTFRRGIIGDWKNHFGAQHKIAFKEVAGRLLIKLGYEQDMNW
jgi:hypothetical protein